MLLKVLSFCAIVQVALSRPQHQPQQVCFQLPDAKCCNKKKKKFTSSYLQWQLRYQLCVSLDFSLLLFVIKAEITVVCILLIHLSRNKLNFLFAQTNINQNKKMRKNLIEMKNCIIHSLFGIGIQIVRLNLFT